MERREKDTIMPHQLIMQDRAKVELTGVTQVDHFDENSVQCQTGMGLLVIRGNQLRVFRLDIDGTVLSVEGHIESLSYTDVRKGGLISRLFR